MAELHNDDLESVLRSVVGRTDAPPAQIVEGAKNLLGWRAGSTGVIELELVDEIQAVRAAGEARSLEFRSAEVSIVVRLDGPELTGFVDPWETGRLVLQRPGDVDAVVNVSDIGDFRFNVEQRRVVSRLRLETGTQQFVTDWFVVNRI